MTALWLIMGLGALWLIFGLPARLVHQENERLAPAQLRTSATGCSVGRGQRCVSERAQKRPCCSSCSSSWSLSGPIGCTGT